MVTLEQLEPLDTDVVLGPRDPIPVKPLYAIKDHTPINIPKINNISSIINQGPIPEGIGGVVTGIVGLITNFETYANDFIDTITSFDPVKFFIDKTESYIGDLLDRSPINLGDIGDIIDTTASILGLGNPLTLANRTGRESLVWYYKGKPVYVDKRYHEDFIRLRKLADHYFKNAPGHSNDVIDFDSEIIIRTIIIRQSIKLGATESIEGYFKDLPNKAIKRRIAFLTLNACFTPQFDLRALEILIPFLSPTQIKAERPMILSDIARAYHFNPYGILDHDKEYQRLNKLLNHITPNWQSEFDLMEFNEASDDFLTLMTHEKRNKDWERIIIANEYSF